MAASPVSGALSPTQLAMLEQIRALRAAKPPLQAAAPVEAAAPLQAKPAATQLRATASATPPANRPRGSIINIVA